MDLPKDHFFLLQIRGTCQTRTRGRRGKDGNTGLEDHWKSERFDMTEVRCWEFASGELGGQGGRSEFIIGRLANWFVDARSRRRYSDM